ncbi:stage II sporulation protein Q [Aneurinibacillus soli]|uniref:Stage II sporulation protein Q n=1 Tax=Aneurinibacillus soli TaxID=1500254 RepID=A0A0U4WCF7_9BACL|nr:M23 family metallopeptidase [Aneurinibacillus soli]PYE61556.1 stage II sporulation protein Q [Aneurinibacillus soli]BAU26489.1 Stage II sporulation protein Q [Aneurinibacillus soli]
MNEDQMKQTGSSSPVKKVQTSRWRRMASKKWIFPAAYMGIAAIILAGVMWYQNSKDFSFTNETPKAIPQSVEPDSGQAQTAQLPDEQKAVPVNAEAPFVWPAKAEADTHKVMNFFDETADKKDQEAALIQYDNSYWPNTGIAIAAKNKKSFEVTAALDGKVTKAERDPMLGYQVEVKHDNGMSTVYASLDEMNVKAGDQVKQGAVVGMAGRNVFEKNLGIHLHFEVHKDGHAVAPDTYLPASRTSTSAK